MKLKVKNSIGKAPGAVYIKNDVIQVTATEAATLLKLYPDNFVADDDEAKALAPDVDKYSALESLANLEKYGE